MTTTVFERSEEEKRLSEDFMRWPFYVYANNLSLHYGRHWFNDPLYYADIISDFLRENPWVSVTRAGSDNFLGAIQMGHSYIPVTPEFGRYVTQRIDAHVC